MIPAACINEPVGFGEDEEKVRLNQVNEPDEVKTLNLKIRNASTFEDDEIEIGDDSTVSDLKEKYAELKDCDQKKVRILYYGRELRDEYKLWNYEINDEIVLIGVINQELND